MNDLQLNAPRFRPLSLREIRPLGWLRNQLAIQAAGLSGHLDEFWPDVRNSQWFGGSAEAWERAPYWLDGLVPLAYLLDDEGLIAKTERYLALILDGQEPDGWLGPRTMVAASGQAARQNYDLWAQILATKVLVQYHDASGDERALEALCKNLRMLDHQIDRAPLHNWGQFRWFEALIGILWLYERSGEVWLLELATKLRSQGFDWASFLDRWPITQPTPKYRWNYMGHVVNNAMAIKAYALWWQVSGAARDRAAAWDMLDKLDRYHGQANGMFTGDECLAGLRPTQGTELCAVVEYAYSLEQLLSLLGDPSLGDRLERVVFNALPATFSPDMWSHQYDQQANQVACQGMDDPIWTTNGPESNLFGVEPNYGCCTANLSQGWPKFAAHLWMRTQRDGLAAVAYAPSQATVDVRGAKVVATLDTDYPFRDTLRFSVAVDRPVSFPLDLRIPEWASGASLEIGDGPAAAPTPGSFFRIEREWRGTAELTLRLPMSAHLTRRHNNAASIERGPLVYALKIGETWKRVHEDEPYRELPHADWEVLPTTPWNYALSVAEGTLNRDLRFVEHPLGDCPFSPEGAPVSATVKGRRVDEWQVEDGRAMDAPTSPVGSEAPLEDLTLIPYGCTNLRVTEFPVLEEQAGKCP